MKIGGATLASDPTTARVLVVDADERERCGYTRDLQGHGFDVVVAPCGSVALDLLDDRRFDATVLDHRVAGPTGCELLADLRAHPLHRLQPIVLVTGEHEHVPSVHTWPTGADDWVTAPVDATELVGRGFAD